MIMLISENPAKRANMQGMGMETGMVPFGLMGGGGPNDQVSDIIQVPDNSVGLGKVGKKSRKISISVVFSFCIIAHLKTSNSPGVQKSLIYEEF